MTDQKANSRLKYRPDIEGLRAIAIVLVVAAHAGIPGFSGGFVGVDIFFVLSGFLITGLLTRELESTGTIAFSMFYARRFRRLLPALLLMLTVASLAGTLLLAPNEQRSQAMSAASAAFWMSNFFFGLADIGYFSPGAETNIFLHTWSLGVEEQFYLVWPLLMLLTLRLSGASGSSQHLRLLGRVMAMIFLVSLALCVAWTWRDASLAFYMMPARAWQFALGALVYFSSLDAGASGETSTSGDRQSQGLNPQLANLLGWLGFVQIAIAVILMSRGVPYPGVAALLPSFGAAVLLAVGGMAPSNSASRLISLRPMQSIGHFSYTWYLWHWPVLVLGAISLPINSLPYRIALAAASALLAALAYRFVEVPIRRNAWIVRKPSLAVVSAIAVMGIASVAAIRWDVWAADSLNGAAQRRFILARRDAPSIYSMGCDDWYRSNDVKPCTFGPADAPHTAVMMGDSIGLQWFPAVHTIYTRAGWHLIVLTKSSCPMVDEPIFYPRIGRIYNECDEWRDKALKEIVRINPDIVLLGSTYTYNFSEDQWRNGTARIIGKIATHAGQIRILRSTPVLPFDGPSCLARMSWFQSSILPERQCASAVDMERGDGVFQALKEATRGIGNSRVIDMTDAICPDGICRAERNGMIVFRDSQHMTASFAKTLMPQLERELNAQ
jgi:peptidoglycan/LPS O-acetylase OafA/YrhL